MAIGNGLNMRIDRYEVQDKAREIIHESERIYGGLRREQHRRLEEIWARYQRGMCSPKEFLQDVEMICRDHGRWNAPNIPPVYMYDPPKLDDSMLKPTEDKPRVKKEVTKWSNRKLLLLKGK